MRPLLHHTCIKFVLTHFNGHNVDLLVRIMSSIMTRIAGSLADSANVTFMVPVTAQIAHQTGKMALLDPDFSVLGS
jgi:hypothetical protein